MTTIKNWLLKRSKTEKVMLAISAFLMVLTILGLIFINSISIGLYDYFGFPTMMTVTKGCSEPKGEPSEIIQGIVSAQEFDKIADKKERADAIYDFVHNIPYDDSSLDRKSPYLCYENNIGDCMGHSLLMALLLKETGIKADTMYVIPLAKSNKLPSDITNITTSQYKTTHVVCVANIDGQKYIADTVTGWDSGLMTPEEWALDASFCLYQQSEIDGNIYVGRYWPSKHWAKKLKISTMYEASFPRLQQYLGEKVTLS